MDIFDNYIPIGYVCSVPSFLNNSKKRATSYVFDRVGTPMWAISDLFANNFDGFMNKDNFKLLKLFDNSDKQYLIDSKYYVRLFNNSVGSAENVDGYVSGMNKRKDMLLKKLESCNVENGETVLFIRAEEPNSYEDLGKRIIFPEYADKYKNDEYFYAVEFSKTIKKNYPLLRFSILLMSQKGQFEDVENNILGITAPTCDYRDPLIAGKMVKHVQDENEFISSKFAGRFNHVTPK